MPATTAASGSGPRCGSRSGRRKGIAPWLAVAIAVAWTTWGGNQFTPLLIAYQQGGYRRIDVDILLGAYVLGLVPGLLLASALSDRQGRRPVLAVGLACSAMGSLVLALGDVAGYGPLLAGRLLSGLAVGIAMAVGSTWIIELCAPPNAVVRPGAGARRASTWLSMGLGAGPLCSGLLATFAPDPLVITYVLHALLGVPVLWLVCTRTVETRVPAARGSGLPALRVPGVAHRRFTHVVVPMAPWIFGSAAIAYAVLPASVGDGLGRWALLYTAAVTVLTLGCGVVVQPIARRLDDRSSARAIVVAMVLITVGVIAAAGAAMMRSAAAAVLVAGLLGAAYGIAIVSGLLEVQRIAGPDGVVGLTGVYYSLAYVGFLFPALLAALARYVSYPVMLACLGVLAAASTVRCASGWSKHLAPRTPRCADTASGCQV
ncbi:MFS transporter [Mycolicibacterium palauense]|uniref:MFS transporter n=1 Tax=Mycolicibacterium palauense TaxID=2034511 RepID=UPI001FEAA959|nr:MFS transporter [Mycolicibacterium palauense]